MKRKPSCELRCIDKIIWSWANLKSQIYRPLIFWLFLAKMTLTFPSQAPDARRCPQGLTARLLRLSVWPVSRYCSSQPWLLLYTRIVASEGSWAQQANKMCNEFFNLSRSGCKTCVLIGWTLLRSGYQYCISFNRWRVALPIVRYWWQGISEGVV